MNLQEQFSEKGFHSCIATTFCVDFDVYENLALPRMRGAGCQNLMVLMDAGMMVHAMSSPLALPVFAGRQYSVAAVQSGRLFHSKIILQVGRHQGRLIVGSANLTAPGLGGNLEIVGAVSRSQADTAADPILAAAWKYLRRFIPSDGSIATIQRDWLERRSPWLTAVEPSDGPISIAAGGSAMFLASSDAGGIARKFANLVGTKVRRLVVVSPYWDDELDALRSLSNDLNAEEVVILLGNATTPFPEIAMKAATEFHFHAMPTVAGKRFVHAKVMLAQTEDADHVLYGSANCTLAALGRAGASGRNDEACLYRRMGHGECVEQLKLAEALVHSARLQKCAMVLYRPEADLAHDELGKQSPGSFECSGERIQWRPSPEYADGRGSLELVNQWCESLGVGAMRCPQIAEGVVEFITPDLTEGPCFARISRDNNLSSVVPLSFPRSLRSALAGADRRAQEIAHPKLIDSEAEEELWLLELLNEMDVDNNSPGRGREAGHRNVALGDADPPSDTEGSGRLTYAEFMRGRKLRPESRREGTSLDTEHSVIHHFLNRVLGLVDTANDDESDAETQAALAVEVSDFRQADEAAASLDLPRKPSLQQLRRQRSRNASRTASTRRKIVEAVHHFNADLDERAALTMRDVVRLRVVLMIVLAAARPFGPGDSKPIQVIDAVGNSSWPRLVGQLLAKMFGSRKPAVEHLTISASFSELPDEVVACWAACIWALQAARTCISHSKGETKLRRQLDRLSKDMYPRMTLLAEWLRGPEVLRVFESLSKRFSDRLRLDPKAIADGHLADATAHL